MLWFYSVFLWSAFPCALTVLAEELEGDVVLAGVGGDAAFLYVPFQHIYTSKHGENWLQKEKNQCTGYSLSSFAINTISLGLYPGLSQAAALKASPNCSGDTGRAQADPHPL